MARLAKVALMPFTLAMAYCPANPARGGHDQSPPSADCVELLVIGDYGTTDQRQRDIAVGLAKVAAKRDPVAIAGIGDNLYRSGADWNQWNVVEKWAKIYMEDDKLSSLRRPWHVITGNHDWYTDATYERDFTTSDYNQQYGGHWQMPAFWFKKTYTSPSGLTVDAFYIDTVIARGYSAVVKGVLHGDPQGEQRDWLRQELASSTADWKIVLGHHPVYSAGSHGRSETLLGNLDPVLRESGVPMYFAGHDHSKQIIFFEGMNYIISGAGGAVARDCSWEYPQGSLQEYRPDGGFVGLQICNKASAEVTIYGTGGEVQATWPVNNAAGSPDVSVKHDIRWASAEPPMKPAQCGDKWLLNVENFCSADGCEVLSDQIHTESCTDLCAKAGLDCARSWLQQEEAKDCVAGPEVACDAVAKVDGSLICRCASKSEDAVLLP
eukprot:gb/GFBE01057743.1/.p1 GENE.gb/GFBE01057743.1/~~gb/GFBE01057743.1/.p1  ORF type:complete len:437 (+),score=89.97 gb/GFBE01057743.1/:1-1311(+)